MRILVIGGIQFMGREMVRRFASQGHDVTVLHRRDSHDLGPEIHNLKADRNDVAAMERILARERFDVVCDVAYDWERGTTAAQVEAAARAAAPGLHRYLFMSSVAAYGPGLDHREEDALAPDDFPNPYVMHKATTERMLFRLHDEIGLPVVTFRPPYVYGPRQPFYREQFFWDRLLDGRPLILPDGGGSPTQWVYVDDVAEAFVRAIDVDAAVGQGFNVAHDALTQRAFLEALARAAGVEPRFVPVSRERIREAGGQQMGRNLYFGEVLDGVTITSVVEKAPRVLGMRITDLDEGLRGAFAWYRDQPRRPVDYAFEDGLLAQPPTPDP
jgi:2'-hydroxyisoflavone reductase